MSASKRPRRKRHSHAPGHRRTRERSLGQPVAASSGTDVRKPSDEELKRQIAAQITYDPDLSPEERRRKYEEFKTLVDERNRRRDANLPEAERNRRWKASLPQAARLELEKAERAGKRHGRIWSEARSKASVSVLSPDQTPRWYRVQRLLATEERPLAAKTERELWGMSYDDSVREVREEALAELEVRFKLRQEEEDLGTFRKEGLRVAMQGVKDKVTELESCRIRVRFVGYDLAYSPIFTHERRTTITKDQWRRAYTTIRKLEHKWSQQFLDVDNALLEHEAKRLKLGESIRGYYLRSDVKRELVIQQDKDREAYLKRIYFRIKKLDASVKTYDSGLTPRRACRRSGPTFSTKAGAYLSCKEKV